MTADSVNESAPIRGAISSLASGLPAGVPGAHVFYEDRVDERILIASSGQRQTITTRTRGLAMGGSSFVHVADPDIPGVVGRKQPARDVADMVAEASESVSRGWSQPIWSAKVVAFEQRIWVGLPDRSVAADVRHGCRVEIRVRVGIASPGTAIQDLVLAGAEPVAVTAAIQRAFERADTRRRRVARPPAGESTAVFTPGTAGIVAHELIGHALEGDVIAAKRSWIGEQELPAAGRALTVVDDPRRGRGAWLIDDESVRSRETILVERGRRIGRLTDRLSAATLLGEPTGHGRRSSYIDSIRPRMGCTFIQPGSDDPEETIRSTVSGVFIRRLATGHTDPATGRAAFVVSDADRIIDGCIAEPLEPFVLELDGPRAWSSIDRVGVDLEFDTCVGSCTRDGQPLAVSVGAPTIRIGVATVHS